MQTTLSILALVVAGQLADDNRYGQTEYGTPPATNNAASDPFGAQPLTSEQPPAAVQQPQQPARLKPAALMEILLKAPSGSQLAGRPTSLTEVARGADSRDEQTRRVEAYWDLTAAVADYYLGVLELTELSTLRGSVAQPSQQWQFALQALESRAEVALRSAQAAQQRLQNMIGANSGAALPLPSDLPHCGRYDTRYEEIFSGRSSRTALLLNDLLPLRHADLVSQTDGVAAAHQWLEMVSQRRNPQTDGTGLLKAHELLILRRRAFVYTVRDYNLQIGRYAAVAAPGEVGTDRLVAMLIRVAGTTNNAWERPEIQQTGGVEEQSSGQSVIPQTYEEPASDSGSGARNRVRREGVEQSILVDPAN